MAQLDTTYREVRKIPINRNNMFYSFSDLALETEIGKNYLEEDVNQTVILYEVDLEKTNLDDAYHESKKESVVFKPPVELHCLYTLEEASLETYEKNKNLGSYVKTGKLKVGVFQATLDEIGCEIKIGDYIGIITNSNHIEFFTVTNDGRNNFDNAHTTFGVMSTYRSIEAAPVSGENEFNGK